MNQTFLTLRSLQSRMQQGDTTAVAQFQREFLPVVSTIVQRMMASPEGQSPLARSIHALAAQLGSGGAAAHLSGNESAVARTASRLCDLLLSRINQARPPSEQLHRTIRGGLPTLART